MLPVMIFVCMTFMWAIGINVTTSILIGSPVEIGGYGFSLKATSFLYFAPITALTLGEIFGHWFNDFIANRYIKKHQGLFVPEVRLWPNYLAIPLMILGLVLTGHALQFKWNYGVIVIGWGLYVFGNIVSSIATTAYIADCYPNAAGEVMGFMNLARVMVCDFETTLIVRVASRWDTINNNGGWSKVSMSRSGFRLLSLPRRGSLLFCCNFSAKLCATKRVL
jgi:MFS family permease